MISCKKDKDDGLVEAFTSSNDRYPQGGGVVLSLFPSVPPKPSVVAGNRMKELGLCDMGQSPPALKEILKINKRNQD